MCNCNGHLDPLKKYVQALHCPTRWDIIRFIGKGKRSSKEIHEILQNSNEGISRSGLYFHLSELKNADIIEVAGYKEEGGGAPEKVWKLKRTRIEIDLLDESSQ